MELAFLYLAPLRFGVRRHHSSVDPYCGHSCLFWARAPAGWRAAHPIRAVGQFRICIKLLPLATQSTGS